MNKYHLKSFFNVQWHFIKNIVSCLLFETAKIRRVEGGSDSITVSARVYSQDLKIFLDTYTNNCMKRAEKTAIYYDDWIKYSGMKQRKTSISTDGNVAT